MEKEPQRYAKNLSCIMDCTCIKWNSTPPHRHNEKLKAEPFSELTQVGQTFKLWPARMESPWASAGRFKNTLPGGMFKYKAEISLESHLF